MKVHTTSDLTILFLHEYYVGEPFRMLDWLNEPCYQQLLDFLSYLSLYISVKDPD